MEKRLNATAWIIGWQDIMPTLLQLAGIPIPESVQGQSMLSDTRRDMLYV